MDKKWKGNSVDINRDVDRIFVHGGGGQQKPRWVQDSLIFIE
jgi:hypothetical protein